MATVVKFEVGESEKHEVVYTWDQMWGGRSISVDGIAIQKSRTVLSLSLRQVNDFPVGIEEKHEVRIVKTRPLLVAGFRPQHIEAFVDGVHVSTAVSELSPRNIRAAWIVGIVSGVIALILAAVVSIALISLFSH